MAEVLELIKNHIAVIENSTDADVIIYDGYGFFANTDLSQLPQLDRWHLKKYCLYVKENPQIFHKCVNLKYRYYNNVITAGCAIKSNCFCGVAEYAAPIVLNGIDIGVVAATGFKGDMLPKRSERMAKRLNISKDEFENLRDTLLCKGENEQTVKTQLEVLSFLLREYLTKETEINNILSESNQLGNNYVLKSFEFIERNFTKDISVDDVAKECYISVPYLQSLFSKTIGHGVAEEIRNRRIKYAKELLLTTEYSVKHIAFECGFESADYFSVAFKKQCGVTPLKFRKTHRNI